MASDLKVLAQQYVVLRDKKRDAKKLQDDIQAEMDQIEAEMLPLMKELDAQNLKLEGVGTVYLQTTFYTSAIKGKEEELNSWLDQNGLGALAKRSVHPSTLKSEYQRWMEEDLPVPGPDLVTAFPKTEIRVRKSN